MRVKTLRGSGRPCKRVAFLEGREPAVLRMLSCGRQNKEIAYALSVSESTVKGYISRLMRAGGFANRIELARWAMFHPELFHEGSAAEVELHLPGCPCDHPRCIEMRAIDRAA